jgi:hypothetical protein
MIPHICILLHIIPGIGDILSRLLRALLLSHTARYLALASAYYYISSVQGGGGGHALGGGGIPGSGDILCLLCTLLLRLVAREPDGLLTTKTCTSADSFERPRCVLVRHTTTYLNILLHI